MRNIEIYNIVVIQSGNYIDVKHEIEICICIDNY